MAYLRVSTQRQGRSGLGLDAQRRSVAEFIAANGWTLLGEFVEIESGRRQDRPQLAAALQACRIHRARLIVAKLDRLARNCRFLLELAEGDNVTIVDMPTPNRLTLSIMAAIAEAEAEAISARTWAALAAAKLRGVVLGTPANLTDEAKRLGAVASCAARRERSLERARDLGPVIEELRTSGIISLRGISVALNARRIPTPRGGQWRPDQVRRILERLDVLASSMHATASVTFTSQFDRRAA